MALKKMLLVFSIVSCSIATVYAQKDYVVTTQKDTLWGKINDYNLNKVKYRQTDSSDKVKYSPLEVDAFHLEKKQEDYQAVQPSKWDKKVFLLRIEFGKISLFEYVNSFSGYKGASHTIVTWYASKGNGIPIEVKSNNLIGSRKDRKDAFYSLIEDNKTIAERYLAADKFSFDQVREVIKQYNTEAGK
ncbi:hypothetical protein [Pedobacter caeni]|uniref:DUF4468 domain-containing protein n=1 Tax=Pedobacter caeni TaxID=288992 RepID=A0A1M5H8B8_9SPHI|nr:hypothetical protein [Pedobacter caeni]SHG12261.1 hypothetical protein SAMN04488522_104549 [Pedobacter caeni]